MSYMIDLDEYSDEDFEREATRRRLERKLGHCTYCGNPVTHKACKFPDRHRPRIVCLCGSTRFWKAFREANLALTLDGVIVLSVGAATSHDDADRTFGGLRPADKFDVTKAMLDRLHLQKIDMADEVHVLNIDGYIGDSTRREIEYARSHGKPIFYLEPKS